MLFLTLIWLFLLGAAMGSFLNVVVFRTIHGDSPLKGRSYCDHCGRAISWKHNIPLISFFILGGRCASCDKKISWQYPVVELITGILFVWWFIIAQSFLHLGQSPWIIIQPVFWFGVAFCLWLVVVFDLKYGIIPDFLSGGLLAWVFFYRVALVSSGIMRSEDFALGLASSVGLMLFFYFLFALTRQKGFGGGDVKLAPSLGLLLGFPMTIVGTLSSFFIGAAVAVLLLVFGRKRFGQTLPFGPFLVAGTTVALLWGNVLWSWYWSLAR